MTKPGNHAAVDEGRVGLLATRAPGATHDAADDTELTLEKDQPQVLITEQQVLITEQEVRFSTAAAARSRSNAIAGWLMDAIRIVGASLQPPPPRRHYLPRHPSYMEQACMAREMTRL
jgi:hypothetical protein